MNDIVVFPTLEQQLIHFSHGRKLEKGEQAPDSHRAKTAAEYLRQFGSLSQEAAGRCYGVLCQLTHPASLSLVPFLAVSDDGSIVEIATEVDEREFIVQLAEAHRAAMLPMFALCVMPAILTLRVLNRLPLGSMRTSAAEAFNLSQSPAWEELDRHLRSQSERLPNEREARSLTPRDIGA